MVADPPIETVHAQTCQIYDLYRNALLNQLYYAERLTWTRWFQTGLDWVLAATASTAIGGWAIWQTAWGANIWSGMGALTVVLSLLRPALHLPQTTERYTKLWVEYSKLYSALEALAGDIAVARTITPSIWARYTALLLRESELVTLDDPLTWGWRIRRLTARTYTRLPDRALWYPERGTA